MWMALINRTLAIIALWLIAFLANALLVARNPGAPKPAAFGVSTAYVAKSGSFELDFRTMVIEGSLAFDLMHARDEGPGGWLSYVQNSIAPEDRAALLALAENARNGIMSDAVEYKLPRCRCIGAQCRFANAPHQRPGGAVMG